MQRKKWSLAQRLIVGASLVYAVVFLTMIALHPGSETFYKALQNTYQIIAPAFACVCALLYGLRGQNLSRAARIGWCTISASGFAFAAGQTTWTYYESVRMLDVPYPGPPDFGYASAGPLLVIGLSFLFGALPVAGRARHLLDSAIAASGVGIFVWYFIASHWIEQIKTPQDQLEYILSAAYPLADIASLFSALTLLSAAGGRGTSRRSAGLLTGGIILLAFADSLFSYENLQDAYHTGSWFDWGWSFGWMLIGYAALLALWRPDKQEIALPSPSNTLAILTGKAAPGPSLWNDVTLAMLGRLLVPYIIATVSFGLVVFHDFQDDSHKTAGHISDRVLALGCWLIFLVFMRQILTLLENQVLTGQLRAFNTTLELKVSQRTAQLSSLLHLTKAVNLTREVNQVLGQATQNTVQALQADAVVIWSPDGDNPELSIPPQVHPENLRKQHPNLVKFFINHPVVHGITRVPLEQIPNAAIEGSSSIGAGECLMAPLLWQEQPVGMIAAVRWQRDFEENEPAMLESIGVEVGTALENARRYAAAVEAADRDPVTELYNHRAIHQRLDEEFHRAERLERPISVIMMDLNNFKLFNDTYGHPVGDQVLKRVARALESECRKYDVLARYGGDEFIAVLPDTDSPLAMVLAQRLSDRMGREEFQTGANATKVPISLSFGVASFPEDSSNRFELITIADRNLYTAKLTDSGITGTTETQRTHRALRTEGSFDVLDAMVTAVDNKDRYTRRHSEDVTEFALWLAEELGYSDATQRVIRIGGLLHDVGKIGVPEDILRKPSHLSADEYETMKRHTQLGALIVGGVPGMESIIDIVRSHHERWDGNGYPDGHRGEEIPLLGRLLAVADAFSAMTTDRPYRKALGWDVAISEIRKGTGTQFDPEMAKAFLAALSKRQPDKISPLQPATDAASNPTPATNRAPAEPATLEARPAITNAGDQDVIPLKAAS